MDQPYRTVPRALAAHVIATQNAGHDARLIADLALFSRPPALGPTDPEARRGERARTAATLGVADAANTVAGLVRSWLEAQVKAEEARDDLAAALVTGQVALDPEQLRRAYLGRGQ